jgi:chromatin assembly factor 1 subunit A
MDSEEEFEEMNGEDINSKEDADDDEESIVEEEEDGWMVPDGYLSEEEVQLDKDENEEQKS